MQLMSNPTPLNSTNYTASSSRDDNQGLLRVRVLRTIANERELMMFIRCSSTVIHLGWFVPNKNLIFDVALNKKREFGRASVHLSGMRKRIQYDDFKQEKEK